MDTPPGPGNLPPASHSSQEQLTVARELVTVATQRLLGDTIMVSDDDWRAQSRLPGWTRGHLATHLARHAEALSRLTEGVLRGERTVMYESDQQRDADIAAGAGRNGLELQIDLDTTAGRLSDDFEQLEEAGAWDAVVEFRGGREAPARLLPLARLSEVVLHHVDLNLGFGVDDIDEATAEWVLEWAAFRLRPRSDYPTLELVSESGFRLRLGPSGTDAREVRGSSARLVGWLTRRTGAEAVTGADGLDLPPY